MAKHYFTSTGDAYDACQTDEGIKNGDLLIVTETADDGTEQIVIGLAGAWPVAVGCASGNFHQVTAGADIRRLAADFEWTDEQINAAIAEAKTRGLPICPAFARWAATAPAPAVVTVMADYLTKLEAAVLDAEWWLADPQVAQRKDMRGERKRVIFAAADLVRQRQLEARDR
jgi:hypothetical protein